MVWELTKDIAGAAVSAWDTAAALRTAWINRNGFLYAYHFETRLNLDLLAAAGRDSLANVCAGSPAFAALVESLETAAGLALLAGHDRRAFRRFVTLLKKHWKPASGSYSDDEPESKPETPDGILDAVSFSVRKIEALKRIVRISALDAPFFPAFNLKKRLDNINACLLDIAACLAAVIPLAEGR